MSPDMGARRAMALLERCGVATAGLSAEEAVRRADEIAAAAADYAGESAEAAAGVFDAHMAAEFERARHRGDDGHDG